MNIPYVPCTGLSGIQFSIFKSAEINDLEGQKRNNNTKVTHTANLGRHLIKL
jgi:hypothetical protein